MIRLVLSGANGSMCQVISRLAGSGNEFTVVAGIDINTEQKNIFPIFSTPDEISGSFDVIIDFSHPSCTEEVLRFALKRRIPIVIATTGLSSSQIEEIQRASRQIPVFFTANMSLGVNLMIDLVKKAALVLASQFDIEIVEKHHNKKIDAPSGTALMLADALNSVLDSRAQYVYDRHSQRKKREKNEIGIHAVRGGTIAGVHEVIFAGNEEIIEITHTATSKEVFANGALKAAAYIKGKKPGLYDMQMLIAECI